MSSEVLVASHSSECRAHNERRKRATRKLSHRTEIKRFDIFLIFPPLPSRQIILGWKLRSFVCTYYIIASIGSAMKKEMRSNCGAQYVSSRIVCVFLCLYAMCPILPGREPKPNLMLSFPPNLLETISHWIRIFAGTLGGSQCKTNAK